MKHSSLWAILVTLILMTVLVIPIPIVVAQPVFGETKTRGPEGQVPIWYTSISLTPAEREKIRNGNYKIAYDQLAASEFDDTIGKAIEYTAKQLNMEYIHTFNRLDAAVQRENIESILAAKPDIISAVSVDPAVSTIAFEEAAKKGVALVFCSNKASLKWNEDYKGGLVFYDLAGFGPLLAEKLDAELGGKGNIGYVYHEANFFITNQRDQGFKDALKDYPGLKIVDERPWSGNPADAEAVVSAMITARPEISGLYLPWQEALMPALAALRAAGRSDVKIVTNDIAEITALEMVRNKNVVAMTQCMAWQYGVTVTELGCYALLGKEIPAECVMVPGLVATKDAISTIWPDLFNTELPAAVKKALEK